MKLLRAKHLLKPSLAGWMLERVFGPHQLPAWITVLGVLLDAPILDVGRGSGDKLRELEELGYTNLTGVDPYAPRDLIPV